MALINCSECGAQVSSKAPACPKCGNTIAPSANFNAVTPSSKTTIGRKVAIAAITIVIGASVWVLWAALTSASSDDGSQSDNASTTVAASELPIPAPRPIAISADDLLSAYKANEVAADAKYKGHLLAVTGIVGSIRRDVADNPYITLMTSAGPYETVNAYFGEDHAQTLSGLHKGESVTVTCRGDGMSLMSPILDCK